MNEGKAGKTSAEPLRHTTLSAWSPQRLALLAGGLYLVLCSLYIWLSGRVAAQKALSVEELKDLETLKGLLFILVSSAGITLVTWLMLRHTARAQQALAESQGALLRMEQRAMAGSLAGTMAHDMNNILTVGCASAEMLRHTQGLDPEQTELARDIQETFKRIAELTRRLTNMGQAGTQGERHPGELRRFLTTELAFARQHDQLRHCELRLEAPEEIPLRLNEPFLQQMILNLLVNAAQAMNGKGLIEVRLRREHKTAILEFHDSGPGIPEDQRPLVFDAFYTTKPEGHGLGLLSVKAAVQMHRGRVVALASPLGGACFRITLPLDPPGQS